MVLICDSLVGDEFGLTCFVVLFLNNRLEENVYKLPPG